MSTNKLANKKIKGKNFQIIEAILTYNPKFCPCCGCINESSNDIIKWGFRKNCIVKIPKVSNCKTRLLLHKQRFYCKNCNNTFIAETILVDRNKNISNNPELQIRLELMKKQSEKDIAERIDVSVSKIDRTLNDFSSHTILRHSKLPKSMNWDEFKATNDTKGKMKQVLKLYNEISNKLKFIIEGTNNLTKTLKLIAFGYIKYDYFIL